MKTSRRLILITLLAILLAGTGFYLLRGNNLTRRAALDIGSGSIKCKVADVDTKNGKIVHIVEQMWRKADFKESIARDPAKRIAPSVAAEGMNILRDFVAKSRELGATQFAAVGTQAFHEASNGREYFRTIRETLGIPAVIITQEQQACLGFEAARQHFDIPARSMVVWDIGAATIQLAARARNGSRLYSLGTQASVGFKNYVIEEIQHENLAFRQSPNPMSYSDVQKALRHARWLADTSTSEAMKRHIHAHDATVIGIGPVHAISIMGQILGKPWDKNDPSAPQKYTADQVRDALDHRFGMTDGAIGGDFANVQITNLILVLGYMEALDIQEVVPASINMADGLLVVGEIKDDQSSRMPKRAPDPGNSPESPAQ
ncbi:Ppx/GppA phosphatase family protein [Pseudodesulfovibrio senegalensis]|uniref:Ppx/GppA phosphatase N-terminal domain-containing protein n=1 Tax=Pseudodesulfovibrio senegalensis TaxID=1721087 RepID=A0A6N6N2D0_9BACT|nr:hypothetical protein [Pseudodesulfovibrio senegalensis]KAB1442101.1 hypothetical protein F8A88_06440 [Pseudodesulfovibrio senegalensis]